MTVFTLPAIGQTLQDGLITPGGYARVVRRDYDHRSHSVGWGITTCKGKEEIPVSGRQWVDQQRVKNANNREYV